MKQNVPKCTLECHVCDLYDYLCFTFLRKHIKIETYIDYSLHLCMSCQIRKCEFYLDKNAECKIKTILVLSNIHDNDNDHNVQIQIEPKTSHIIKCNVRMMNIQKESTLLNYENYIYLYFVLLLKNHAKLTKKQNKSCI